MNWGTFLKTSTAGLMATAFAGCAEEQVESPSTPYVHVTNAEKVLKAMVENNQTGVVFHMKSDTEVVCEHTSAEFGIPNEQEMWDVKHVLNPGKDSRETFGQSKIEDQLHFFAIGDPIQYGVLGMGCKPYSGNLETVRGLFATFDVEDNKLNYIGEIGYDIIAGNFMEPVVQDRSDFARTQIETQLPALLPYFHVNTAKLVEADLTEEEQEELSARQAKMDMDRRLLGPREEIARQYNDVANDLKSWQTINRSVIPSQASPEAQREYLSLTWAAYPLKKQLQKYDRLLAEKRDVEYIEKYMDLYADFTRKEAELSHYMASNKVSRSSNRTDDLQRIKLSDAVKDAEIALRDFTRAN